MGLYLCVFASSKDDEELEGVELGSYDDFGTLRSTVADRLEGGQWASRFPMLMSQPDSDGEWSPQAAAALSRELRTIEEELRALPSSQFADGSWQSGVAKMTGLVPATLADCFIDIDGEPLFERLRALADLAADQGRPISFQ